jgi:hypothetical protein
MSPSSDNFYENGVTSDDPKVDGQWNTTYRDPFAAPVLQQVTTISCTYHAYDEKDLSGTFSAIALPTVYTGRLSSILAVVGGY